MTILARRMRSAISFSIPLCLLLASSCATSGGAPKASHSAAAPAEAAATAGDLSFALKGTRIIGCCCYAPCPCRINQKPSYCHGCHYTEAVHIDEGQVDGVKVDGLDWVFVGRGFGEQKEDNWSYAYVCDRASEPQVAALGKLFAWMGAGVGMKAPFLLGKGLGMRTVPMQYSRSTDRREVGVSVPGLLEFKTRAIVNPGRSEPVTSSGILDSYGDRFVHAEALVHKLDDQTISRSFDLAGRQANQADFALDSKRVARGGIGWGCWSAHADLGDKRPYADPKDGGHACCDGESKAKQGGK
jgi:hypothetical protein